MRRTCTPWRLLVAVGLLPIGLAGCVRIDAHRYVYADVTIVCGSPELEGEADVLKNPNLIVEVLSASTEAFDRGEKFVGYRSLPSIREVVLVSQDARRLECYSRQLDDSWILREHTGKFPVPLGPVALTLAQIYEGVEDEDEDADADGVQ